MIKTPLADLRVETRIESQGTHRKLVPTKEDTELSSKKAKPKRKVSVLSPLKLKKLQLNAMKRMASKRRFSTKHSDLKNLA